MSLRILWVKMGGLWPPTSGGRLRSLQIVSELARHHQVTLLTTHGLSDDPNALRAHLAGCERVLSVPYTIPKTRSVRFFLALLRSWLSSLPVDVLKFQVPALAQEVRKLLASRAVDVCVADFLSATGNVPLDGSVPGIFFAHNVEHLIWKRLREYEHRSWLVPFLDIEWRKLRRYEAAICTRAAATVCVSDSDQRLLTALASDAIIRAIPTGVDSAYFAPNGTREVPSAIVFSGSMDWYPNEDAVLHFVDAVLPRIRGEIPDTSFAVVGRNPSHRLRTAMVGKNVRLTGTVDDVRPYIAEAAVVVVPLRIGGGTRLKIFEALAMGKAVLSSTVGAEGLPLTPGEHFIKADTPDEFAAGVVALLRDPARRRALGAAGRRLVEEQYSWSRVAERFADCCEEAMAASCRRH